MLKRLSWVAPLALALSVSSAAIAARQVPIVNPQPVAVSSLNATKLTARQVRAAIIAGGAIHGWMLKNEDTGKLVLKLEKGKYYVELNLPYSADGYRIEYVRSENLNYEGPGAGASGPAQSIEGATIHSGYGRWLENLTRAINSQIAAAQADSQ